MTFARTLPLALALAAVPAGAAEIHFSGSAYADYLGLSDSKARASTLSGLTPEVALKVEADVHESLSFAGKVCFGCHGLEVERAYMEFTPRPWLNVQAGRLAVPFGDFSQRADPANHRTASKPLPFEMGRMAYYGPKSFNLGVVPAPYVDNGVMVYGQAWPSERLQVWYGAYAIGGFKGENDIDFASMRAPYYIDNNRAPAGGGRGVFTYAAAAPEAILKDASLGLSGMTGRYDRALKRAYTALGIDLTGRVGPVTLRAEAAYRRTDIDPSVPGYPYEVIDPFVDKSGFYLEVEHPLGSYLLVVYRLDGLRRAGAPLPQSDSALTPDSSILRYTQGLQVLVTDALFVKLGYEYWWLSDLPAFHAFHLGAGGSF